MNFQYSQISDIEPIIKKYISIVNANEAEMLWHTFLDWSDIESVKKELFAIHCFRPDLKKYFVEISFSVKYPAANTGLKNLALEFLDLAGYTGNQNMIFKTTDQLGSTQLIFLLNRINYDGYVVPDNFEPSRARVIAKQLISSPPYLH